VFKAGNIDTVAGWPTPRAGACPSTFGSVDPFPRALLSHAAHISRHPEPRTHCQTAPHRTQRSVSVHLPGAPAEARRAHSEAARPTPATLTYPRSHASLARLIRGRRSLPGARRHGPLATATETPFRSPPAPCKPTNTLPSTHPSPTNARHSEHAAPNAGACALAASQPRQRRAPSPAPPKP
jgi:hypothetical protein